MNGTVEACAASCLEKDWCKSFDYEHFLQSCHLSDMNKEDIGTSASTRYDYYEKNENGKYGN